jgi:hypothetical protein
MSGSGNKTIGENTMINKHHQRLISFTRRDVIRIFHFLSIAMEEIIVNSSHFCRSVVVRCHPCERKFVFVHMDDMYNRRKTKVTTIFSIPNKSFLKGLAHNCIYENIYLM